MTIITKQGNLLDAKGIIVHGCNCRGVMGSGVALAIKNKWPHVFKSYRIAFESVQGLKLGSTQVCHLNDGVTVINAMTQESFGNRGLRYVNYEAVARCFDDVRVLARHLKVPVNFPLLGAGLGGGNWEIISTIIDQTLGDEIEKILWVQ